MKKIFASLFVVLSLVVLVACGNGKKPVEIKLSGDAALTLEVDETKTVTLTVEPEEKVSELEVAVDKEEIATATIAAKVVSVKGVKAGSAEVTVTLGDKTHKIAVTVKDKEVVVERTYPFDGVFSAFKIEAPVRSGVATPQVTSVTVVIENDEVKSYYIDVLQGHTVKNAEDVVEGVNFNEQTKKELGFGYKMHWAAFVADTPEVEDQTLEKYEAWLTENDKLEWHQQAALIEAKFLAEGVESITVNEENVIDNVAGVTINDGGYIEVAKAALANAKAGKVVVFKAADNGKTVDFYTVELTLEEGAAKTLVIDTLQSTFKEENENKFAWNTQTKHELKEGYGMAGVGPKYKFEGGEWVVVADEKCELEWYEQATLIQNYVLANYNKELKPLAERGATVDGETLIDALSGVTVKTATYFELIHKAFENAGL